MKIVVWNECYISGGADWSLIDLIGLWPDHDDSFLIYVNETHEGFALISEKLRDRAITRSFVSSRERMDRARSTAMGKLVLRLGEPARLVVGAAVFLRCLFSCWNLISRKDCDLLLMNNGGYPGGISNFAAALVAKFKRIPRRVMIIRNYPQGDTRSSVVMRMCTALVGFAVHRVVAVSDSLKRALEQDGGFAPGKVVRIYNGVDVRNKFSGNGGWEDLARAHAGRPKVGVIGSLEERKGHDVLFRAWPEVVRAHPGARLFVAGAESSGPENKARLVELAKSLGISETVVWLDFVRDIGRFYEFIDVVVMPSLRYESFGRAVIEGMAFKKAVIASRVGGIPELFEDGREGRLFEKGDHEELARALTRALADPEERKEMADNAYRKYKSRFTAEIMARNYCGFLHALP